MQTMSLLALAALLLMPTTARSEVTPACRSAVEVALSGYAACDMTARSKNSRRPDAAKLAEELQKCTARFESKFFSALGRYGAGKCPTETSAAFGTHLDGCVVAASEAAGGAALPNDATCAADLATCEASLAAFMATPTPSPAPTASPEPTPVRFVDNGNGTVTDSTTGLIWEQKTDDGGVHDWDNGYSWTAVDADPWPFDGTAKTQFLDQLNCQGLYAISGCTPWLGHNEWRLPGLEELYGITVSCYPHACPNIDLIFGPHARGAYWSSATAWNDPRIAFTVARDSYYSQWKVVSWQPAVAVLGEWIPTPTPQVTPTPTPTPCAVVPNGKGGAYTDNCDGTVIDSSSGLVWEKKTGIVGDSVDCGISGCPDPHNVNNTYTLSTGAPWSTDGTTYTNFLARLNCTGAFAGINCSPFAGWTDWRLPTVTEISGKAIYGYEWGGIVDVTASGCSDSVPCINQVFGPTRASWYWAGPTISGSPDYSWVVGFGSFVGGNFGLKTAGDHVRAVRP